MSEILTPPQETKKAHCLEIRPYVNEDNENYGLTHYGLVLFDGGKYRENITCLGQGESKRWVTGLNENAPEIRSLKGDEKEVAIKDIRTKVAYIEKMLGASTLDIDDAKFWDNVKFAHPTNHTFWNDIVIEADNSVVFLDPEIPEDLVKICAIEAGGVQSVAKSYEDAQTMAVPPFFYLHKVAETASSKVEVKKIKNKAIETLSRLYTKGGKRLFYIAKVLNTAGYQYKNDTPLDVIYEWLDEYISGKGTQKSVKLASTNFNVVADLSEEDLRIKAVIADASFYKLIEEKSDGGLYHRSTTQRLGKNVAEVLAFFKNKLNAGEWDILFGEVENYWKN